ncbi:hypothetical protein Q4E93_20890 [Flavitalea sp. BT771]|uniref:hypothetical protein n=1 Tax=Flavitalea sp. BT771 TaxID=3063329 RepID=UPI0026E17D5F|nr:hypothetical protein [Flavitalea sp. BT771]MDO6433078.1 hypothetical protein [Flavitalea sp. BT771]MDV6221646.1 hypothetical protein [Flavitalea sp. BT771]
MNDNPEENLRKELIEDYFLEITELIGGENLRTEIDFKDDDVYSARLQINVSGLTNEQDLDHFIAGLKSIIRRINIIEKDVKIGLAIELEGLNKNG